MTHETTTFALLQLSNPSARGPLVCRRHASRGLCRAQLLRLRGRYGEGRRVQPLPRQDRLVICKSADACMLAPTAVIAPRRAASLISSSRAEWEMRQLVFGKEGTSVTIELHSGNGRVSYATLVRMRAKVASSIGGDVALGARYEQKIGASHSGQLCCVQLLQPARGKA